MFNEIFLKKNLPFNDEMLKFWNDNGYLVIEDFNSEEECDKIIEKIKLPN